MGLTAVDPARYGTLQHPGDGFAFDIYTQVTRAVRAGAGLDDLAPQWLVAAGQSQSAFALATYYNGVQPLTAAFDAFYVHSRGAAGLPLVGPGEYADIAIALTGPPAIFRTDEDTPVLNVQAESDVTGPFAAYRVRQPDDDRLRIWEVAGTAHADVHLLENSGAVLDCGVPINDGPLHVVAKAGLRALTAWIETGEPPASAPYLDLVEGETTQIARDANGNATGGVRTPPVDVPVATLSAVPGTNPSVICLLIGSTVAFPPAQLEALYPSRDDYLAQYEAGADEAIAAGFVLDEDREALMDYADPAAIAE
jgi:hypothetical protein